MFVYQDEGIPECPEEYMNESIIQVLAQFYSKYKDDNKIDELREEDKLHKWGIQVYEFHFLFFNLLSIFP